MRTYPMLLAVGLTLAACDDGNGPSPDGTLVVSTSTVGNDPDPDGYLLTVDDADSLALDLTGTAEINLPSGKHTLRLLDVAEHCSVTPETSFEVDVSPQGTTPVAFEISCAAVGARITTTTTGLDIDPNGYRVAVDGAERGTIPSNGTVLARVDAGSRTIVLAGLTPNCAVDGPSSRTITITEAVVVPIEFTVICTATSGVIGVVVEASGAVTGVLWAAVDGAAAFMVGAGGPRYLTGVSAGDHAVSLIVPDNCSVLPDSRSVTVTIGQLVRDTVEAHFSVTCEPPSGNVRITAPTTGNMPSSTVYEVWYTSFGYWDYGGVSSFLGVLSPNDTLVAELPASEVIDYWYQFELKDVPAHCSVSDPHPYPLPGFTITPGDTLDVEFAVACSR